MQCNIVCNGTLSLGQGRLVGMHDCSSAPIVLLVEHARAAGTSRDMRTGPTIFCLIRQPKCWADYANPILNPPHIADSSIGPSLYFPLEELISLCVIYVFMAYLIKFWRFRYKLYKHQKACFYVKSVVGWLADDTQINY